jgi:hypothetical protein
MRNGEESQPRDRGGTQQPGPEATQSGGNAIGGNADGKIHQGEDQLVGHQDPDHPLLVDARLRQQLRQVNDIHRPAADEKELDQAEVDTDACHRAMLHCLRASGNSRHSG